MPMTTHTVNAPGATVHYDVREADGQDGAPPLMLIALPMDAAGFTTLAGHFPDRTVVTYDPRGAGRSTRIDDVAQATPEEHADDVHRVIEALGRGPVDLFASSGGAVNALALVARHPEQVRTLVAHEPPAASVLPDRDAALAATTGIHEAYQRDGFGPAMAQFIVISSLKGEIPAGFADQPAPDPAQFGLPTEDDGSRNHVMFGQNIVSSTHYEPDFDALRAASTRIVVAAGAESEGELAHRGALGVAERLGTEPVIFPSHHGGFLGGEYGQAGDPDAFAAKLRAVLSG
jgi:pimeloyl-ACP methyl ester carboxylesterase